MKRKKILKLVVGTNNPGKLREIKHLLPNKIKIFSPQNFGIKSPKENGKTFKENSLIKAKFFSKKTGMVCLADDSGLEIDILNKKPGIFSSRWAGKKGNFNIAIQRVFKNLNRKDNKWKYKKLKPGLFVPSLFIGPVEKKYLKLVKLRVLYLIRKKGKMVLVMIQYLFLTEKVLHLHKCLQN